MNSTERNVSEEPALNGSAATAMLRFIDQRLDDMRRWAGVVCRYDLANQLLGMAVEMFSVMRNAPSPWARSFEMRGEECQSLHDDLLVTWRSLGCLSSCGCDCAALLAMDTGGTTVGERGVW